MSEDNGERSEEATQARRDDFRKRGQVAHSKELSTALLMLAASVALFAVSKHVFQQVVESFRYSFGPDMIVAIRSGDLTTALKFCGEKMLLAILPVMGATLIIGVGSQVAQTGFLQTEDAFAPNFDKINPIEGFKRMFSLRNLVEGVKAMLKLILVFSVVAMVLKSEIIKTPMVIELSVLEIFEYMGHVTMKLLGSIGLAMGVLAAGDYFFQRWDLEKRMRMTKQEIKEENKSREGDPMIKARVRRIQREMANRRMMQKVPQADVIITNPTHIAVAIRYGADVPAPQLLAKGGDLMAEKIKDLARQHNIPIVENKPLARTIFKTMKIGQVIPRELFVAVAEVLSYVYKLRKKVAR